MLTDLSFINTINLKGFSFDLRSQKAFHSLRTASKKQKILI